MSSEHYHDYNDYNNYDDYRDSDLDLDLDWEWISEIVTYWHSWLNLNHDMEG